MDKVSGSGWLHANKDKLLPVPGFVTREWLAPKLALRDNLRLVRGIHDGRQAIRDLTGYDWPDERPDKASVVDVFLAGLRHANFVRVLHCAAERCLEERKRDDFNLFRPFYNGIRWAYWDKGNSRNEKLSRRRRPNELIDVLLEAGRRDDALALIYFSCLYGDDEFVDIVRERRFDDLEDFLTAFEKLDPGTDAPAQTPPDDGKPEEDAFGEDDMPPAGHAVSPEGEDLTGGGGAGDAPRHEPAHPSPAAGAAPADAATAALHAWQDAMLRLAAAAQAAAAAEPAPEALEGLSAALGEAGKAASAFEAARPRLVDAASLTERVLALLERLAGLQEAPDTAGVAHLGGSLMVPPDVLEEASVWADAAGQALNQAEAAQGEAVALMKQGTLAMLGRAQALSADAAAAMAEALEGIRAAAASLTEAVRAVAPPVIELPPPRDDGPFGGIPVQSTPDNDVPDDDPSGGEPAGTAVEPAGAPPATAGSATLVGAASAAGAKAPGEAKDDPAADPGYELAEAEAADDDVPPAVELPAVVVEPPAPDPLVAAIAARLDAFMAARAFGPAFHLLRAARSQFPDATFRFSGDELRLAAMSGRMSHGAMQGSALLERVVTGAVDAVQSIGPDERDDVAAARRIVLSAACAELAIFHPTLPATVGIDAIGEVSPELSEAFHALHEALAEGARLTFITPALLRAVGQAAAEDRYLEESHASVIDAVATFSKLHFNWIPAIKIRASLCLRSGVVGALRASLEQGNGAAVDAAKGFAAGYRERSAILALIDKVDAGARRSLDGPARERMVAAFENLAALCAEYVEAYEAAPAAGNSSQNALVRRVSQSVAAGIDRALGGLAAYRVSARPLPGAAAEFAEKALGRLRDIAQGRQSSPGIHDHLLAVHGPLLWLPGLHYGTSWLPSPYLPEALIATLLDPPYLPFDDRRPTVEEYRAAIRARLKEGSFIAARMLVHARAYYGVDEATAAAMTEACEADVATSRSALRDDIDETRRMVDKVQRLGGLVRAEQANATLDALDRINPDTLPHDVSLDARGEDEESGQVMDFCSARQVVDDVKERIRGLLDAPRNALLGRLDALTGAARPGDIDRVRGIIQDHDDLVTAREYIEFLADGGALPETTFTNRRFHELFPGVTDALGRLGKGVVAAAADALKGGRALDALAFDRVPPERRGEALGILGAWTDLRRRIDRGLQAQDVHAMLERLLTAARLSPEVLNPAPLKNLPPKTFAAEFRLNLAEDKDSLLLPDFGSLTGHCYRVCVAAQMPTDGELALLRGDAGTYGVVLLVTAVLDTGRRERLVRTCRAENLSVLVFDEAILLYALTEPEFRPLTLFECAQPFSFAAPYRDYGSTPVPPEMFFGRETEIRKITERMGSCIVYGGRRLGKTALLRHVQALHADPHRDASTVVGYANLRDVGAAPSRVWEYASRNLPDIFPAPVRTAGDFIARVRSWLDGDARRRVLLLLDEADGFIEGDARDPKRQFSEFTSLQDLMDGTGRRFKVVLAGLHNVTRIVRTENSPLKQIASDPQRIGPLMDDELKDAERLVARPLSAMGYEFQNRGDIWRILSHCNYYPVLIQTFCAGLLERLRKEPVGRKPVWEITGRHVRDAIDNEAIRKVIGEIFDYTIREIDPRYELIACVVAERALRDSSEGRVDEGMSPVDVLEEVCTWWPQAFDHPHRLETVKDLLDEMVGLGVLRQTPSGAWALRSRAILRLLGDEDHVATRLLSFREMLPPRPFDPRAMRRTLNLREAAEYPCPLTMGQEHDLFADDAHVTALFGNAVSDIRHVAEALRTADPVAADGARMAVTVRTFATQADLADAIRDAARGGGHAAVVADPRTRWDASWIETALRQRPVRERAVRLVLIGDQVHALQWARDPRFANLPPAVQTMSLQTWTDAYLEHKLGRDNLSAERFAADLHRATGGFNRLMASIVTGPGVGPDRFANRIRAAEARLGKDRRLLADLGLSGKMEEVFRRVAEWADAEGRIDAEAIPVGAADALQRAGLTAEQAIWFGTAMGVLEPRALGAGEPEEIHGFVVTPLLRVALAAAQVETV